MEIGKIAVSDDGLMWATYCRNGYILYIGDFAGTSLNLMQQYKNATLRDIKFRPGTYEVTATGGDFTKNVTYLYRYEPLQNKHYNLPISKEANIVISLSYASSNIIYALEE